MYSLFFCSRSLKSSRSTAADRPGFPRTNLALSVLLIESPISLFLEELTDGEGTDFILFDCDIDEISKDN